MERLAKLTSYAAHYGSSLYNIVPTTGNWVTHNEKGELIDLKTFY